jgi:hypothetical protein
MLSRALCIPLHEVVAIKRCSLASLEAQLDELMQETQLMARYRSGSVNECLYLISYCHLAVSPLKCSFLDFLE